MIKSINISNAEAPLAKHSTAINFNEAFCKLHNIKFPLENVKVTETPKPSEISPLKNPIVSSAPKNSQPNEIARQIIDKEITKYSKNKGVKEAISEIYHEIKPILPKAAEIDNKKIVDPLAIIKLLKNDAPGAFNNLLKLHSNENLKYLVKLVDLHENYSAIGEVIDSIPNDYGAIIAIDNLFSDIKHYKIPLEEQSMINGYNNTEKLLLDLMKDPKFDYHLSHQRSPLLFKLVDLLKENNLEKTTAYIESYKNIAKINKQNFLTNQSAKTIESSPPIINESSIKAEESIAGSGKVLTEKSKALEKELSMIGKTGKTIKFIGKIATPLLVLLGVVAVIEKHKDKLLQKGQTPEQKQKAIAEYNKDLAIMLINLGASIPDTGFETVAFGKELFQNRGNIMKTIKEFDSDSHLTITTLLKQSGFTDYVAKQFSELLS